MLRLARPLLLSVAAIVLATGLGAVPAAADPTPSPTSDIGVMTPGQRIASADGTPPAAA